METKLHVDLRNVFPIADYWRVLVLEFIPQIVMSVLTIYIPLI